jgi:uncharacterized membrane protein
MSFQEVFSMKILLLNNNPVVTKLVTLSAQKTSDELDIIDNIDAVSSQNYDLLIIDDALYTENTLEELSSKIKFIKSLYICSKNAEIVDDFNSILKKPFLPTELVELFASLANSLNNESETDELEIDNNNLGALDELDEDVNKDDLGELDDLDEENKDDLGELDDLDEENKDDLGELDDFDEESTDDLGELDDLDEENKDDLDEFNSESIEDEESEAASILDKEDLQEVQDLLEETEVNEDNSVESNEVSEVDELEEVNEEELELSETSDELEEVNEDLESQIESAVLELSDEDLQSEIDGDILLGIDSLTSKDLKIAIGEEINEEEVSNATDMSTTDNNGVEALKKLLQALSNEDVVASLKGMKININITLGGN